MKSRDPLFSSRISLQSSEECPYLEVVERLVTAGRGIPLDLLQLPLLESHVAAAKAWRDRTSRTFLRKNSLYTLMQVRNGSD